MKSILILNLILLAHSFSFGQDEDCCGRYAILNKCEVSDPMKENMYNDAYCMSLKTHLVELMTFDCFHFLNPKVISDYASNLQERNKEIEAEFGEEFYTKYILSQKENELLRLGSNAPELHYTFNMNYVSGLNEVNENRKPIRTKMSIEMFFEGEEREFVHQWETIGTWDTVSNTGTTWRGHMNKFKSAYNEGNDIDLIIEEFEKCPAACTVNPELINAKPGELIEIELSDFEDLYGERSREFNRIVVHAFSGEIVNGEECKIGPNYKVFRIGEGNVKLSYKAPKDCEDYTDNIKIYNSCQVLPSFKEPMNETMLNELIAEKTVSILCADAVLTLQKKADKTIRTIIKEDTTNGNCKTHSEKEHVLNRRTEVLVTVSLEKKEVMDMPIFNQSWEYYFPIDLKVSKFDYGSKERKVDLSKSSGVDCAGEGYNNVTDIVHALQNFEIEGEQYLKQLPWIIVVDNKTGKAVKFIPAGYDIAYEFQEKNILNTTRYSNDGTKSDTKTSDKLVNKTFKLGPVGKEIPDPTIKKSDTWMQDYLKRQGVELPAGVSIPTISNEETIEPIQPDILVKFGDGLSNFGGEGEHIIRKDLEHGFEEEKLSFTWIIAKRK